MGDDLIFARSFVSDSAAAMERLISGEGRACEIELSQTMTQIQSAAKSLHARSIYQSAQAVLHSLNGGSVSGAQTDGRLLALNKLLVQYEAGLNELAPLDAAETSSGRAEVSIEADTLASPMMLAQPDPSATFKTARSVLQDMLPHASDAETENLTRLMTVRDRTESAAPKIPVDTIMRDIVQDALAIARICAKTISLSFDVGETELAEHDLTALNLRLSRTLRALVLETLPADKLGHIDISADDRYLQIKAQGPAPRFGSHDAVISQDGETCVITLPVKGKTAPPPNPAAVPAPMITGDAEVELRAQLSKLMEPQNLAEPNVMDTNLIEAGL